MVRGQSIGMTVICSHVIPGRKKSALQHFDPPLSRVADSENEAVSHLFVIESDRLFLCTLLVDLALTLLIVAAQQGVGKHGQKHDLTDGHVALLRIYISIILGICEGEHLDKLPLSMERGEICLIRF